MASCIRAASSPRIAPLRQLGHNAGMTSPDSCGMTAKPKRRRPEPAIPPPLRREVTEYARHLGRKYRHLFESDRELKNRLLRLQHALLPPRPKPRGRPGNPRTTRAIALLRRLRRQHPNERPRERWNQICSILIPEFDRLTELQQWTVREELRESVRSRLRKRTRRN